MGYGSTSFLGPLLQKSPCRLINLRNGLVLSPHILSAFDSKSRRRGLLGLDAFPVGRALIIAPTGAIHTWFMRFAIDVAFAARDGRVIRVRHAMPPWRMFVALRAYAAIELPSGTLAISDTIVGDKLGCEPI
jgi:uncharacterized membrane protein (UPF0127 family)